MLVGLSKLLLGCCHGGRGSYGRLRLRLLLLRHSGSHRQSISHGRSSRPRGSALLRSGHSGRRDGLRVG